MKLEQRNISKYPRLFSRLMTGGVVIALAISVTVTFSKTAHANLMSLVSSLLGGESVSAKVDLPSSFVNSQTIAVLQSSTNIDPVRSGADIVPVANGDTLIADLASSNSVGDTSNSQISTYIVREGDTISDVAKMFKVSVNTVLWANGLSGKSSLKVGQTLVILPISGFSYTVKKGDTIGSIAQKCNAGVTDILNFNDIPSVSSPIKAGQSLMIPDADPDSAVSSQCVAPSQSTSQSSASSLKSAPGGYYVRPITGGRISQGLHGHNAIDFAAPIGTPILASAAGTVIIAKLDGAWNGGYGSYVVISHANGTQTLYAHMLRGAVSPGQTVYQGQIIGYIGVTGKTTGPHVHFEIRGAKNPF